MYELIPEYRQSRNNLADSDVLKIEGQFSLALLRENLESKSVCSDKNIHNGMPFAISAVGPLAIHWRQRKV